MHVCCTNFLLQSSQLNDGTLVPSQCLIFVLMLSVLMDGHQQMLLVCPFSHDWSDMMKWQQVRYTMLSDLLFRRVRNDISLQRPIRQVKVLMKISLLWDFV